MDAETDSPYAAYKLGIDTIDDQHAVLFDCIGRLEAAIDLDERWLVVHDILVQLSNWARVHFSVEEALMEILQYPDYVHHCAMHELFETQVDEKKRESLTTDVSSETAVWLRTWLVEHIDGADRDYAEYYRRVVKAPA
jgi:hemerythrin